MPSFKDALLLSVSVFASPRQLSGPPGIRYHEVCPVQFSKGIVRSWGLQMPQKNTGDITGSSHAPVHRNSVLTVHFFSYLRLLSSAGFYSVVGVGQGAEGHADFITSHR